MRTYRPAPLTLLISPYLLQLGHLCYLFVLLCRVLVRRDPGTTRRFSAHPVSLRTVDGSFSPSHTSSLSPALPKHLLSQADMEARLVTPFENGGGKWDSPLWLPRGSCVIFVTAPSGGRDSIVKKQEGVQFQSTRPRRGETVSKRKSLALS